ncbi:MAG: hypothetical protein IJU71_11090 [Selenomonadaceae bacterium]|nr:hypothetical protein [Selenomonadaceae bacterium]
MNEKLEALMNDEAFVKDLLAQETAEDAQQFLAAHDIDMTIEELNKLQKKFAAQSADGEMDDDQLEMVAGGRNIFQKINDFLNDPWRGRTW